MRKRLFKYALYLLLCLVCYFVFLPVCLNVGGMQFVLLLVIMPLIFLVGSGIWGYFYSFDIIPAIMAGLLFIPCVYLFMNGSALIYALIYGLVALLGLALGYVCRRYISRI